MTSNAIIDLNSREISFEAYDALNNLDKTFIGTESYLGIAYFWNYEYRHYLRDCTMAKRRKIHKLFIKAGLPVDGESPLHKLVIENALHGVTLASGFTVGRQRNDS